MQSNISIHRLAKSFANHFAVLAIAASTFVLTGCVSMGEGEPSSPAMVKRSVMTAQEIETLLKTGTTSNEIIAALERRGGEQINSAEVESLRKVGASHALIDTLIRVNQPTHYVWVAPPRFSVFFGRSGWYWVDSFGWPVYPQPHSNWSSPYWSHPYPPYPVRIRPKPSPKENEQSEAKPAQVAPVKPSVRRAEKEPSSGAEERPVKEPQPVKK